MDLELLDETLSAHGEPGFRAGQVWRWAAAGAGGYGAMTNLPRALRETLAQAVPFSSLEVREEAHARDGTVKALFHDRRTGVRLEAVLMRYRNPPGGGSGRRSICLSSQSGCPLTCTFCATGAMKFARNLSTSEILDQALHFRRIERVDHCVFMGMGEPLLNLDAVLASLRAAAGPRHHPPAHRDLDGGLDPGDRTPRGVRAAAAPGALAARGRRSAALGADAGQRALPAHGGARGVPGLLRA